MKILAYTMPGRTKQMYQPHLPKTVTDPAQGDAVWT